MRFEQSENISIIENADPEELKVPMMSQFNPTPDNLMGSKRYSHEDNNRPVESHPNQKASGSFHELSREEKELAESLENSRYKPRVEPNSRYQQYQESSPELPKEGSTVGITNASYERSESNHESIASESLDQFKELMKTHAHNFRTS